jgi:hypothetical protein
VNDLDVSADYMDRLLEEITRSLPQVYLEHELEQVQEELKSLNDLSGRFRSAGKVGPHDRPVPAIAILILARAERAGTAVQSVDAAEAAGPAG